MGWFVRRLAYFGVKSRVYAVLIASSLVLGVLFQNCGQGFRVNT